MPRSATATVQLTDVQHAGSVADVDVVPETLVQRAIDLAFHPANIASAANATTASTVPTHVAHEPNGGRLAKVLRLPPPYRHRAPAATLHPVQEWEGYVVDMRIADCVSRPAGDDALRSPRRANLGTRYRAGVEVVTDAGVPPGKNEFEITLFGPGYGESVVLHVGNGAWIVVDSCIDKENTPVAIHYLNRLGVDPAEAVTLVVATHWHDDHIRGMARLVAACTNANEVWSLSPAT